MARPPKAWPGTIIQRIQDMVAAGMTAPEICYRTEDEFNVRCVDDALREVVRTYGITPPRLPSVKPKPWSDEKWKKLRELAENGMPHHQIGLTIWKIFGDAHSADVIRTRLHEIGIRRGPRYLEQPLPPWPPKQERVVVPAAKPQPKTTPEPECAVSNLKLAHQALPPILLSVIAPARTCQFPFGEPRREGFRFCGEPSMEGKSYCPVHYYRTIIRRPGKQEISQHAAE